MEGEEKGLRTSVYKSPNSSSSSIEEERRDFEEEKVGFEGRKKRRGLRLRRVLF